MKKKISKRALFIKAIISAAFFWILISFVQTNELIAIFSRINWYYFALSFALLPVMLFVSCMKWKMVLDLNEKTIPFWVLIRIYLIGYFFSNLLPSTVGGDVVRSYYSGKKIDNQSFAAIAIFIERFSGVFFLFLLVLFSPLFKADLYSNAYIYIPSILSLVFISITLCIWWMSKPFELPNRIVRLFFSLLYRLCSSIGSSKLTQLIEKVESVYNKILEKLEKLRKELGNAVQIIKRDKFLFLRITGATVLFYFLTWINVYIAFLAFDVRPEFLGICAIVPTVLFVAQIPVTLLGNLGFYESVFVFYFLLIGVSGAETLAMGLLLRLKMLSLGGAGYLVYLFYSHTKNINEEVENISRSRESVR